MAPKVTLPLLHCFRCIYSWTPARSPVRMCPRCKSRRFYEARIRMPPYDGGGLGVVDIVTPHRDAILSAVKRHGFLNPRVFGSVARGEANVDSDLDLLVTYRPSTSLLDRNALIVELEGLLNRKVDVVPDSALKWYAEPEIRLQAVPL